MQVGNVGPTPGRITKMVKMQIRRHLKRTTMWVGCLFAILVFSVSCSGGGGTNTQPPAISNPSAQSSLIDSAGQASFVTSEGNIVNFKVVDSTSRQPLANISLSLEENQNGIFITNIADANEAYAPIINFINIESQSESLSASQKYLSKSLSVTISG